MKTTVLNYKMSILPTIGLLVVAVLFMVNAHSHEHAEPGCVCPECAEPSINHEDCEKLGGYSVHNDCHCCETCEILVGEGQPCKLVLGQFPHPRCNSKDNLVCIGDVCKKP
ncbi:uncharacterized protein [Anabrus simplex]|uniref:uncharacterized protein n=1 Tax=Anabrus simplex TaxID=316456 RepID=UPI0035A3C138